MNHKLADLIERLFKTCLAAHQEWEFSAVEIVGALESVKFEVLQHAAKEDGE